MALIKYTRDYTQTPHSITNDKKLSLKAKGLWTFLNSKPQNWNFSVNGTSQQNKDGKDGITAGMKELEQRGLLKRVPVKDENGTWAGHDYHLFDEPQPVDSETTVSGFSANGKTVNGKTATGFNGTQSNTEQKRLKEVIKEEKETPDLKIEFPDQKDLPTEILDYLNDVRDSSRGYSPTRSNLADIKARLKEKFTFEDFKKVIDYKNAQWKKDPKMKQYIRPSTLFGSKFNEYIIQAENNPIKNDGSGNFKFNPSQKADLK